jgi:hypothetical protein
MACILIDQAIFICGRISFSALSLNKFKTINVIVRNTPIKSMWEIIYHSKIAD